MIDSWEIDMYGHVSMCSGPLLEFVCGQLNGFKIGRKLPVGLGLEQSHRANDNQPVPAARPTRFTHLVSGCYREPRKTLLGLSCYAGTHDKFAIALHYAIGSDTDETLA